MQTFFGKFKYVKFRDILHVFLFLAALPVALIYKLRRKDLWLVCDNGNEAADNGFVFFKYVCEKEPQQDCVFAICKNSPDREKVEKVGKTVYYGTFRHWVLYLTARVNISSQKGGKPNYAVCNLLEVYGILRNNRVFLQHGVILTDIEFLYYKNTKMSLFTTSTTREYEFVRDNYGYPEGAVQLLGLPRFDEHHSITVDEKQILIMPTWREWLGNSTLTKNISKNIAEFTSTEYFKYYSELINDEALTELCVKNGFKIKFYLHREAQRFADCFTSNNPNLEICKFPNYRVDELLKTSAFLVTDYSSIQTDFGYMKKPLCYFHFDYDRYTKEHYQMGYFDYQTDGFGPVFEDAKSVAEYIVKSAENNFENPEEYKAREDKFFDLYDANNCKRNFEAIKEKWS